MFRKKFSESRPNIPKLEEKSDIKGLKRVLENQTRPDIRLQAVQALGRLSHPACVPTLLSALNDRESYIQSAAIRALITHGSPEAVESILQLFASAMPTVQIEICRALVDLKAEFAIPTLWMACNATDQTVREAAQAALTELGVLEPSHSSDSTAHMPLKQDGIVRVFLSSDFQENMDALRTILVTRVFPRVRMFSQMRGVDCVAIDLRWGIPEEDSKKGNSLRLCLEAIDDSDYFIGIFLDHYGNPWYVEDTENKVAFDHIRSTYGTNWAQLMDTYTHVDNEKRTVDRSFTELEMRYLMDMDLLAIDNVLFLLSDDTKENKKLKQLKDDIKSSPYQDVGFHSAEQAATVIENWLLNQFIKRFPYQDAISTAIGYDQLSFEQFFQRVYISRDPEKDLNAYLESETASPFVLVGEPGSGKTALIANWSKHVSAKIFYISNGTITDSFSLARHIVTALGQSAPSIDEPYLLHTAISDALDATDPNTPITLIIDGINALQVGKSGLYLDWLPSRFPSHVKLILSTCPKPDLMREIRFKWKTIDQDQSIKELLELDLAERQDLIRQYATYYIKRLSEKESSPPTSHNAHEITRQDEVFNKGLVNLIANIKPAASPLFLTTLMADLIIFNKFEEEELAQYITNQYQAEATTFDELLNKIFTHWTEVGVISNISSTRYLLALLSNAPMGLTEGDLFALLSNNEFTFRWDMWLPLRATLDPFLAQRSDGIIIFASQTLGKAIQLYTASDQKSAQLALTTYFKQQVFSPRKAVTLLHLPPADDPLSWLTEAGALTSSWNMAPTQLLQIIQNNIKAFEQVCNKLFKQTPQDIDLIDTITSIYRQLGNFTEAVQYQEQLILLYKGQENPLGEQNALMWRGDDFLKQGNLEAAFAAYKMAEDICTQNNMHRERALALGSQGNVLMHQKHFRDARQCHQKALELCEQWKNRRGIANALSSIASLDLQEGSLDQASAQLEKAMELFAVVGDDVGRAKAISNQGIILQNKGLFTDALPLQKEASELFNQLSMPDAQVISLISLAQVLGGMKNYEQALITAQQALALAEKHQLHAPVGQIKQLIKKIKTCC